MLIKGPIRADFQFIVWFLCDVEFILPQFQSLYLLFSRSPEHFCISDAKLLTHLRN